MIENYEKISKQFGKKSLTRESKKKQLIFWSQLKKLEWQLTGN